VADLSDQKKASRLAKDIVEGEEVTMVCHLVKVENPLGRSTVIDLTAKTDNKFRMIDHRTIQWIIYNNTKYTLKKGAGKKGEDEGADEEQKKEKWDPKQLAVGNWFSSTGYFKVKQIAGDNVTTILDKKEVDVSRDILEKEMFNASVFVKEEKLALTKVVKILKEAGSVALTVCFNMKVQVKQVEERLRQLKDADLKNTKVIATELLTGNEKIFVGRLTKTEGKLGRSLLVGLESEHTFGQVDHRNINWLILKNVKYVVA
jgi:hypothetical protein